MFDGSPITEGYSLLSQQKHHQAISQFTIALGSAPPTQQLMLESAIALCNIHLCNYSEAHAILVDLEDTI